jgi:hypothetical protein
VTRKGAARSVDAAFGSGRLPGTQEANLRRILAEKDEVQYGARARSKADAEAFLARLEEYATWAEAEIARPQ